MIKLGEIQTLGIERKVEFGAYLSAHKGDEEAVLLPGKQLPEDAEVGDGLEVFVYRDSKDRLIATVNTPLITVGETAVLKVCQVNKVGAFLNMGLERDLLLPYHEQTYEVKEGDEVLVTMYIDKSKRLAASMKVYEYLDKDSPYKVNDEVEGLVYEISRNFGAFVAVDRKYSGLIPAREFAGEAKCGDIVKVRVTGVKEDGKLDLSIRKKAYLQMNEDAEALLELMRENHGHLDFTDKASPELIKDECSMSKNAFKRAVGHLLKEGLITIGSAGIDMKEKE
ncbi:S1 RNA-binding domain-containing protein [Lachnospiraceae bacterium C1.1]|nr:S1-like domain-containing RNA-binding protein [Lachnospiraceae bacterium C1.1]